MFGQVEGRRSSELLVTNRGHCGSCPCLPGCGIHGIGVNYRQHQTAESSVGVHCIQVGPVGELQFAVDEDQIGEEDAARAKKDGGISGSSSFFTRSSIGITDVLLAGNLYCSMVSLPKAGDQRTFISVYVDARIPFMSTCSFLAEGIVVKAGNTGALEELVNGMISGIGRIIFYCQQIIFGAAGSTDSFFAGRQQQQASEHIKTIF